MIDITDPELWGNEAADDEDPETLDSYFVDQPTFRPFFDSSVRLSIARARKGLGKSALLRLGAFRLPRGSSSIVLEMKGADLAALRPAGSLSPDQHLYDWQQRLCMTINRELGVRAGLALNDDTITLVETAELAGWRRRNLVGALVDRLLGKIGPAQVSKVDAKDHRALFQRLQAKKDWDVWLFIDDIDATFRQSPEESLRLSTFFSACRAIVSNFSGVHIRTCVRTDVWTSIRRTDEALDKCEQYIFDISWSQRETGLILAERVASYLGRQSGESVVVRRSVSPTAEPNLRLLERVFTPHFPWGRSTRPAHSVIHVYSAGRPRWAAQLCRMAAKEAASVRDNAIKFGHIKEVLTDYGRFRLDDIAREHKHQCPEVSLVVNAFSRHSYRFSTNELLEFVATRIISSGSITIEGGGASALSLAHFLFRIGFLIACERTSPGTGGPRYYSCDEKPELLMNSSNFDDDCEWHIHPSFQAALGVGRAD
jgi:hypothetical protein